MSDGTVDDKYIEWLYEKIGTVANPNPNRSYWKLAHQLYVTPFLWFVPNDDNRALDGCELRYEFADETGIDVGKDWLNLECSMLEMFVGLARRASFESFGSIGDWFWKFMQNLELKGYSDAVYSIAIEREVNNKLETIIQRRYDRNGNGGIFPLRECRQDQRQVELWYQLSAYLLEGDYIDHGPLV